MPDATSLLLFIAAALVLLLTPGPAVIYIVTRSVEQGRLAGIVSSLGIQVGTLCHVVAAALGLSAVLMSSAVAFSVVKYAGAAYLVYLGIRTLAGGAGEAEWSDGGQRKLSRLFAEGVVVNVLNPKTAAFFLAFLPQFVDASRGAVWQQVLILGAVLAGLAAITETAWALAAGTAGNLLREHRGFQRNMRYVSGGVYVTLGLAAAFSGSHKGK
jgi:threonine/homoserine/homoserine lactone efflux protein